MFPKSTILKYLGSFKRSSTCYSSSNRSPSSNTETPKNPSTIQRFFHGAWIQPAIGLTTLLITLIALFVYSHRSFVMAKWTEENDMLQACAQLIQDQSNTTYSQCEKLIATGPRPPPYLKGDMYRPGIQARKLGAQALDIMKMKRRSLTLSGLAHGSSRMDGDKIDELQDGTGPVHTFTPADVVILATFAMFILLAIAKVCWVVGYSRHRSRGASFTVTTRQVFTAIFRDCLIFHRGTNGNMMEHCIAIKSRHVGSVGVLRNIRRRLHHHRQDDIIHELLGSDRVLLDQYPHVPIEPQTDSIAVTSGLST